MIKTVKKLLLAFAMFTSFFASTSAHAGIPVIDAANLANSVQQVMAWAQQYQQMTQQIEQLTAQINAVTGGRGMGALLNNPQIRQYLPPELSDIQSIISGSGMTTARKASAKSILERYGVDTTDASATVLASAAEISKAKDFADSSASQLQTIDGLKNAIDSTSDLKASVDLSSRILTEMLSMQQLATQKSIADNAQSNAAKIQEIADQQAKLRTKFNSLVANTPDY